MQGGSAAADPGTSGWYVTGVPRTGGDDVLLGSSRPNAQFCIATGVTIFNINSSSTFAPLVDIWNGSSWTQFRRPFQLERGVAFSMSHVWVALTVGVWARSSTK